MNENEKKRKSPILARPWILALALVLVGGLIALAPVAAKYLTGRSEPQEIVDTYDFYFRSNYLTDETTPPEIRVNAGVTSVDVELYNFEDELRIADLQINYVVTVQEEGASQPTTVSTDHLTADTKDTKTVTISGLENGKTYTVTAVGTNGYSKTLRAKLVVDAVESKVYMSLQQTGSFGLIRTYELTVWTVGDAQGTATIGYRGLTTPLTGSWPASVSTSSFTYGTDSTSFTGKNQSQQYTFIALGTLTLDDFSASITDGVTTWTGEAGTP